MEKGIIFPYEPESLGDETFEESDLPRYMPMTKEEEAEKLHMALSFSAKSKPGIASSPTQIQSQRRQQATHETIDFQTRQYPEQVLQPQTASWFCPTVPSYMHNIPAYFNQVHQPEYHYQPPFYYPQNNSTDGSRGTSSCSISSPAQTAQYSHQDNELPKKYICLTS